MTETTFSIITITLSLTWKTRNSIKQKRPPKLLALLLFSCVVAGKLGQTKLVARVTCYAIGQN